MGDWEEARREAEASEAWRAAGARHEAAVAQKETKRAKDEARTRALRCLGKLSPSRREDEAVGRALAGVDGVRLLGAWTRFVTTEGGFAAASTTARRCRRLWRTFGPTLDDEGLFNGGDPVPCATVVVEKQDDEEHRAVALEELLRQLTSSSNHVATSSVAAGVRVGDELRVRGRREWVEVVEVTPQFVRCLTSTLEVFELWGATVLRGKKTIFSLSEERGDARQLEGWALIDSAVPPTKAAQRQQEAARRRSSTSTLEPTPPPKLELFACDPESLTLRWVGDGKLELLTGTVWGVVFEGEGGAKVSGLKPATEHRIRLKRGTRFALGTWSTTADAPPPPTLRSWSSTPGTPERTAEFRLKLPSLVEKLSPGARYVLERYSGSEWERVYSGKTPRCQVAGLIAGEDYYFRVALACGVDFITPHSEHLALTVPLLAKQHDQFVSKSNAPPPKLQLEDPTDSKSPPSPAEDPTIEEVPAPPDDQWEVAWSEDRQRPFYYNPKTQKSQWTPPLSAWQ